MESTRASRVHERLARGYLRIEQLEREREKEQDAKFGKGEELSIINTELFDLEVQAIDDHIQRLWEQIVKGDLG